VLAGHRLGRYVKVVLISSEFSCFGLYERTQIEPAAENRRDALPPDV